MNKFDLYWFDYVNQDGTKKTRPVLLLEEGIILPIAEVTSHDPRTDKDYKIIKWQEAGLTKPSTIRFDKIQFATSSLLKDPIGSLDQEDIDKIKELKLMESIDISKLESYNNGKEETIMEDKKKLEESKVDFANSTFPICDPEDDDNEFWEEEYKRSHQ